jgi:hypothetical protein
MILQQQIYDLLLGTRRDFNKMSNASIKVLQLAAQQVGSELMVVDGDYEEQKQIEENTDNGKDTS